MPRDLFLSRRLGRGRNESATGDGDPRSSDRAEGSSSRQGGIHPLVQILSLHDLDACGAVEDAAFPEHERCSREKVTTLVCSHFQPPISPLSWLARDIEDDAYSD